MGAPPRRNVLAAVLALLVLASNAQAQQASLGSGLFDVFNGLMTFFPVPAAPPFTLPTAFNQSQSSECFCGVEGAGSAQPPAAHVTYALLRVRAI